jgi:hypothetical protein
MMILMVVTGVMVMFMPMLMVSWSGSGKYCLTSIFARLG